MTVLRGTAGAALLLVLGGCASVSKHTCPIPEACAPVQRTLERAEADTSESGWVVGGAAAAKTQGEAEGGDGREAAAPRHPAPVVEPGGEVPVYEPPRPWRAWLAPWVDDQGGLHSGQYVWFTTPGAWVYLGRRWPLPFVPSAGGGAPGEALEPVAPDDLGFEPVTGPAGTGGGVVRPAVTPLTQAVGD